MISLIYSVAGSRTGLGNYSERLIKGLSKLGLPLEQLEVIKREYSLGGRPLLGNLSLVLGTKFKKPRGNIIHSLSPEVIHPRSHVVTVHDIIPLRFRDEFSGTLYRSKGNEMIFGKLREIDHIITFTQYGKKELVEIAGIDANKISVVRQSIDHELFYRERDEPLSKEGKKLIVTVGDLNPRKRYDLLFSALGGMDEYEVLHIGPTNAWLQREKDLKSMISEYDNIKMIGAVDQETLRKYISSSDLLVHLSHAEGFGSTPVEAMACGTNVLVNDLEIFKETLNGMAHYTSLETEDIRKSVENALKNPKQSSELIEYSKNYSIQNMAKKTAEVYSLINPDYMKG